MYRETKLYLNDILTCIERIQEYTDSLSLRSKYDYDWRSIAGLRDILIHEYFGVSKKIVWDIIQNELPALEQKIREILKNEGL